jgi:hypothetical protein
VKQRKQGKKKREKVKKNERKVKNRTNLNHRELPPLPKHQMGVNPINGG